MKWNETEDAAVWDGFTKTTAQGTIYDSWKWRNVLESQGHQPIYLLATDARGAVQGCCPFYYERYRGPTWMLTTWPEYSEPSGPLFSPGASSRASELVESLLHSIPTSIRLAGIHIRTTNKNIADYLSKSGVRIHDSAGFFLVDLQETPPEVIQAKFFKKHERQNVRYFEDNDLKVTVTGDQRSIEEFHALYSQSMLRKGYAVEPLPFLTAVSREFQDSFKILFVRSSAAKAAGALLLDRDRGTVHLMQVGYERPPSHSILFYSDWVTMNWARENGFRFVNMGNGSSNPNHANFRTKKRFGGAFVTRYWCNIYLSPLVRGLRSILGRR
jgi:hypothetical protein